MRISEEELLLGEQEADEKFEAAFANIPNKFKEDVKYHDNVFHDDEDAIDIEFLKTENIVPCMAARDFQPIYLAKLLVGIRDNIEEYIAHSMYDTEHECCFSSDERNVVVSFLNIIEDKLSKLEPYVIVDDSDNEEISIFGVDDYCTDCCDKCNYNNYEIAGVETDSEGNEYYKLVEENDDSDDTCTDC